MATIIENQAWILERLNRIQQTFDREVSSASAPAPAPAPVLAPDINA